MADDRIDKALLEEARTKSKGGSAWVPLMGDLTSPAQWYSVFEQYYQSNGLYDALAYYMRVEGLWMQGMKPLRNPVHRAVEFHVAHLWPGALPQAMPITASGPKKDSVTAAIQQVWAWSNWGRQKQLAARTFSNLGDLFIKVPTHRDEDGNVTQVFLQSLPAANVIDFHKDARDYLTYIRIDTFQTRITEDGTETYVLTEVWDKDDDSYRTYEHMKGKGASQKELGDPKENKPIQETFGFNFLPFVHAKFCDVGESRGDNCYMHALDKIDEANMMATRLHQLLFRYNKPTTVVMANAEDKSGRPLPPPSIQGRDGSGLTSSDTVKVGDEDLYEMPGYSKLEHLIPDINYADALSILQDQMVELEADLPEILYYELKEKGELSGKALQTILSGAVDRALEARGNAESALTQAHQMALTIGQLRGLKGFEEATIGTYEAGDFEHTFVERDVISASKKERGETVKIFTEAGLAKEFAMKQTGFTDAEIDEEKRLTKEQREAEKKELGELVLGAMRDRDQGTSASSSISSPDIRPADTAMNGAQIASLVEIIAQVSSGQLPPDAAVQVLQSAFPSIDEAEIQSMVNAAVKFNPAPILTNG